MMGQVWEESADPQAMLNFLRGRASDRKLRLFAAACCRRICHLLDRGGRKAAEVAELYADGAAGWWTRVWREFFAWPGIIWPRQLHGSQQMASYLALIPWSTRLASEETDGASLVTRLDRERPRVNGIEAAMLVSHLARDIPQAHASILRDLFGNPFNPLPAIAPDWLSWEEEIVRRLAEKIYAERAFDRLPVLADALEEAGCANGAMLNHCRQPGVHVRGCWVLDLLLGKT